MRSRWPRRACRTRDQASGFADRLEYYAATYVGLEHGRDALLYERIDARVDAMLEAGLLDEVRRLLAAGFRDALTAQQAIGYKEFVPVIETGAALDDAVAAVKQASRRYAKRQLVWFRADPRVRWIDVGTSAAPHAEQIDVDRTVPRLWRSSASPPSRSAVAVGRVRYSGLDRSGRAGQRRESRPDWSRSMELAFTKMHGLGNDFIVIEDLEEELEFSNDAVRWFCDRNFGIGADGLILVRPASSSDADYYMHYINSDGSLAEMCGNGIRCFAKYLVDRGLVGADRDRLVAETLGGPKAIAFTRDEMGALDRATVNMGAPKLAAEEIPTTLPGNPVLARTLDTGAGVLEVTCVSMGNPHCITWVDDVETAPVEELGPLVECHEAFPNKTNVEFAQLVGDAHIRLRVWERGCGETLACGTGACATAVAASLAGLVNREATVELPGGDLEICWDESDDVYMTGPAEEVFRGVMELPEENSA